MLYRNLRIRKLKTRDEQEVAGYLETLELVFGRYRDIPLGESTVLQLHRDMLKYSGKDARHKGGYKFGPNRVEARDRRAKVVGIIFEPTPPHMVQKEMQELVAWYAWATARTMAMGIRLARARIQPQDGDGRTALSRQNRRVHHQKAP